MGLRPRPVSVAAFGRAHVLSATRYSSGPGRTVLRLPPPQGNDDRLSPTRRACRPVAAPSGPWHSYHGGRSPPPSLIPGAHQVPARAMAGLCGRREVREYSCENYFRERRGTYLFPPARDSDFNGLTGERSGCQVLEIAREGKFLFTFKKNPGRVPAAPQRPGVRWPFAMPPA